MLRSPAISQPQKGQLYGWLPLSNAYRHFFFRNIASSTECAPERGNEPPAQGNTLGNKGNITDGALTGQKLYRWEENAFAPPGRNYHTAYNPQGVALGYMIVGLSGRRSTGML